jgi:hypothetical protein
MASTLGGYFLYQLIAAYRYPREPALFPQIVGVAGVLLSVSIVVRALISTPPQADRLEMRRVALAVAVPIIYGIALWLVGYWVASAAVLVAFPVLLGYRRVAVLLAVCAGVVVFFGVALSYLEVSLPKGLLFG